MKERFTDRKLNGVIRIKLSDEKGVWEADKAEIVAAIIEICERYKRAGDNLTLRQLYYQLVSMDVIPNHDKVYKKIGSIKDDIVYSGKLDWAVFEDRGRQPINAYYEDSVKGALERTVDYYKLDRQRDQPIHIEVWTEKDAISGILKKITLPYSVSLVVNKGYNSSTAMYNAYSRFCEHLNEGKKVRILYFGDHDASGLDMVRDIRDRIEYMFCYGRRIDAEVVEDWWLDYSMDLFDVAALEGYESVAELMEYPEKESLQELFEAGRKKLWLEHAERFEVQHIGLTMDQIKQYDPPPNPAKITDPRAKWYIKKFGPVSWEVDALTPDTMRSLVEAGIKANMDAEVYEALLEEERSDQDKIRTMINSLD